MSELKQANDLAEILTEQSSRAALDRMAFGVALIDVDGQPSFVNRALRGMARQQDGLDLDSGGIRLQRPDENRSLGELLEAARLAAAPGDGVRSYMQATRPSGQRPYGVLVCPLAKGPGAPEPGGAPVLVCITDPAAAGQVSEAALIALFSLSHAEAKLTISLIRTGSLASAARDCGLTGGSARQYLKRIFAKTKTRGQVDLVALLLGSVVV